MRLVCKSFAAAALVATLGCGGGSDGPTTPTEQPYNQTLSGTVSAFGTTQHAFNVPRSGTARITLAWSNGGDLDLYLTGAACNSYPPDNCQILAAADGQANPELITRTVTSGEQFKLWVDSFVIDNARSYTITLTIN